MIIGSQFEQGLVLIVFSLLGVILIGSLLVSLRLERCHPRLIGAILGATLGAILIEYLPLIT
ncbi:hypothetical protein PTKU64_87880 [Paraburkholderia terrae]|uniref:Uncharacterized protein n=1 Tax=Paraburkholderia terrae TaxID=311230 RepID=A0ABN6JYU9_9BURK|nr:hypothetical protein [Paraburkholderia terrae]BCZ85113.1 hypothetical protein PTKU64_87880 [Paraburkholderia terrae]